MHCISIFRYYQLISTLLVESQINRWVNITPREITFFSFSKLFLGLISKRQECIEWFCNSNNFKQDIFVWINQPSTFNSESKQSRFKAGSFSKFRRTQWIRPQHSAVTIIAAIQQFIMWIMLAYNVSNSVPHIPFQMFALKVCAQPWMEIRPKTAEKDAERWH